METLKISQFTPVHLEINVGFPPKKTKNAT